LNVAKIARLPWQPFADLFSQVNVKDQYLVALVTFSILKIGSSQQ
jgi:hypothetical protein